MDFDTWKRRPGPATLSALLVSVEGRVQRICRRILRNDHDADEARQEVLLEIAKGLESVEDGARFDRWVGTVAFRTALDRRRMRLRREAREREAAGRPPNGSHRDDALHEGMSKLDDDQRELLIERYFDRRTLREMGARRGISAVAVRKRIAGARDRLKRSLVAGGVVIAGASIVKAKTAAAIAIILLPLLFLGGGVWVAAAKQSSKQVVLKAPMPSVRVISEPFAKVKMDASIPNPVTTAAIPVDTAQLRSEIVASWRRLRYDHSRAAECKRSWPEALTDEECRRLVQEKATLDSEALELRKRLPELASSNPGLILEIARNARDLEGRLSLLGLVTPEIDAEVASGGDTPLLKELLALASGDAEEKAYFAAFATQLWHANSDIGQVLVKLLADEDFHVRKHAVQALHSLAQNGALRSFLAEQLPQLKQAAQRHENELDYLLRDQALMVMATLGTDEADGFVLQQFEALDSRRDLARIRATALAARRIVSENEPRLVMAILRALDLPGESQSYYTLVHMTEYLSPGGKAAVLAAAETRKPPSGMVDTRVVLSSGRRFMAQRNFTFVSHWSLESLGGDPSVRR